MKTETIINNVNELARKKGISISALERKAGLARGHIYKLKNSTTPQLETLEKLATALDVSLVTLLRDKKRKE